MPYNEYLDQAVEELEVANLLFEEKYYREAVSRAYYSMFHATQALLLIKEIYPKSHKGVIQKFGEEFVKSGLLEKKMGYIQHDININKATNIQLPTFFNRKYNTLKSTYSIH